MPTTRDAITEEIAGHAIALMSTQASDRLASLQTIIAFGLQHGVALEDIRNGIARQRGAALAGSLERAPMAWSDAAERDFWAAYDSIRGRGGRASRQARLPASVEDGV